MKRFLFVMFEGGGNVPPQLGIVRRLVRRGHEVRVLGDRVLEPDVKQAGASFAPFQLAPHNNMRSREEDRVRDWEPRGALARLKRAADHLMFGPAEAHARDLLDEVDRFAPDALAIDCLLYGAVAGAERSGLPAALLMHAPGMLPLPGVPPFGLGLRPGRGPLGRLRDRLLWKIIIRTIDKLGRERLNAARAAIGLPALANVVDSFTRLPRTLLLSSPAFDFAPAVLPPGMTYAGAPLDDPSWVEPWRSPFAGAEAEAKPLVVVALGSTFQNQGALTQRAIDALADLPVRGLVTLGNVFTPSEFRVPPGVHVVASAPHAAVLPQARAVVAHGGHGTVIKALAHGVPLVCIPLGRDQKDNAARAAHAGAGVTLSPSAGARAIHRAITKVLDDPRFAENARRLADAFRRERAIDPAVTTLESLASAASSPAAA